MTDHEPFVERPDASQEIVHDEDSGPRDEEDAVGSDAAEDPQA